MKPTLERKLKRVGNVQPDPDSFAHILRLIIGGPKANLTQAAKRLNIMLSNLSPILHGRAMISLASIEKKGWRKTFATYYPQTWELHKDAFEERARATVRNRGVKTYEPEDKNSFGHLLWTILGGEKALMKQASVLLDISQTSLSAIIHGRQKVTKKFLHNKDWGTTLATHFPDTWKDNAAAFNKFIETLSDKTGVASTEPKDEKSLGHLIWLIIGGEKAHIADAANLLGVDASTLSANLQGQRPITLRTIRDKNWSKVLSDNYPHAWGEHAAAFSRHIVAMIARDSSAATKNKENVFPDWHEAAGNLVSRVLMDRGDDLPAIIPEISTPALRSEPVWERIVVGDKTLPTRLYQEALGEICRLYNLKDAQKPDDYQTVQRLLSSCCDKKPSPV